MVAKITTSLTNIFAKYIDGETTIFGLNDAFSDIEVVLNNIIDKIIEKGYTMSQVELRKIEKIGEAVEVFNSNIEAINSYLLSMSQLISSDYLISKEVLSTMRVDFINKNTTGSIRIEENQVIVELGNEQVIKLKEGIVESSLGVESLSLTHA